MKLSQKTLTILKNFSTINNSLLIEPGNVLRTAHLSGNLKVLAPIPENFEVTVAIYDLSQFLKYVSLFKEPEFDFEENYVEISEGNNRLTYMYSDVDCLFTSPKNESNNSFLSFLRKKIGMKDPYITFDFTEDSFSVLQAAQVMGLPQLKLQYCGDNVVLTALDNDNSSLGNYSTEIEIEEGKDFDCLVNLEYFKILRGDYKLSLAKSVLRLANEDGLEYYIVMSESNYGDK